MVELLGDVTSSTYQQAAGIVEKLNRSIESAGSVYSLRSELKVGNELEADSESESSESTDDGEKSESIRFYISLLMNLVPSMEQAYSQISQEAGRFQIPLLFQTSSTSTIKKPQSSESLQSETDATSLHEVPSTPSNIVVNAPKLGDIYGTYTVKEFRRMFELMMDARPISRDAERSLPHAKSVSQTSMQAAVRDVISKGAASSKLDLNPRSSPPPPIHEAPQTSRDSESPEKQRLLKENSFNKELFAVSCTPLQYENSGLLDEALLLLQLGQIYDEADEESQLFLAQALSLDGHKKPLWRYQDCVIRALMR